VSAKAPDFYKSQQLSTSGPQQVQYQSLKNKKSQQIPIDYGIWFGTRGSEVQILSPRPFIFSDLHAFKIPKNPAVGKNATVLTSLIFF